MINRLHHDSQSKNTISAFSDAWKSPFKGLKFQFLEYEILKLIMYGGINEVSEIISIVEGEFQDIKKSKSQLYRIIENLETEGLISSEKLGKEKVLKIENKGIQELGNLSRYVLISLREILIDEGIWNDIYEKVLPQTGCLRVDNIAYLGPQAHGIVQLLDSCRYCESPRYPNDDLPTSPIFFQLPYSDTTLSLTEKDKITIIQNQKIDDLMLKTNSLDIVLSFTLISKFKERSFEELKRIVKPEGFLIFVEPVKTTPHVVIMMYNQILMANSFETSEFWRIDTLDNTLPSVEELENLLMNEFTKVTKIKDSLLSIFVCQIT